MEKNRIKLTDEEVERILSAEVKRRQESAPPKEETPKKQRHIYVAVDDDPDEYNGYVYEIVGWIIDLFLYRLPTKYYLEGCEKLLDILSIKYDKWLERHPLNPYIAEFLYIVWYYHFLFIICSPIVFLVIGIPFGIISALGAWCMLYGILIACILILCYDVYFHLLNLILGKPKVTKNVELASFTIDVTNPNCDTYQPISYLPDIYPVIACSFFFWYNPLPKDAKPKSSRKKKPPDVFGDDFVEHQKGKKVLPNHFVGREVGSPRSTFCIGTDRGI